MRKINEIIVHCTATRPDWWQARSINQKVQEVRKWHTSPPHNWADIGYHYLIDRDGAVARGRTEDVVGAHVKGRNANSIGIALFGGFGSAADDSFYEHFTPEQAQALRQLIDDLKEKYPTITKISGHNEYANKACPGFRVRDWLNGKPARAMSKRVAGATTIAAVTAGASQVQEVVTSLKGAADAVIPAGAEQDTSYMAGLAMLLLIALAAALGWMLWTRYKDAAAANQRLVG